MSKTKRGLFRILQPHNLWRSPCEKAKLTDATNSYPCLKKEWNNPHCPMCSAMPEAIKKLEVRMYKAGYVNGAWVVRKDWLHLSPRCTLVFFKDELTEPVMRGRFGKRFLRFTSISPCKTKKKP